MNYLIDIYILVYGQFELLRQCLESIPGAFGNLPYRVYLWDNGSPSEELPEGTELRHFYSKLKKENLCTRYYLSKKNKGFPLGNNLLASKTKKNPAPLMFFLNSDVVLDPGSGEELVRSLDDPEVGVAGMKLIFPDFVGDLDIDIRPPGKIQHVGLSMNINGHVHHIFVGWDDHHPRPNEMSEVWAVTGAALMTRRKLFEEVEGFDPVYGLGTWEDVDLCLTIKELGFRIVVNTQARGLHYTGASAVKYKVQYPMDINRAIFFTKWKERGKIEWTDWRYL